jgi:hypothetical protein
MIARMDLAHSGPHLGVWAIFWTNDRHDTGFHDHDTSRGAVRVARGAIRHEHLCMDGGGAERMSELVPANRTFSFDETTIHAYSPPLERTGQYANRALLRPRR